MNGSLTASVDAVLYRIGQKLIKDQSERHRRIIGKVNIARFANDFRITRKHLARGIANSGYKLLRIKVSSSGGAVQNLLSSRHRSDSTTRVIDDLSCFGTLRSSGCDIQERLQHLHVVFNAMIEFVEQNPLLRLGLLAFADIDQHVHRAYYSAGRVAQGSGIRNEWYPRAVRTLGDSFRIPNGPAFLESEGHRALVMR